MIGAARDRVAQGLRALRPTPEPEEAALLARYLTPAQAAAFRRLPAHDRGHLVRVARAVAMARPADETLITAALLHDVGKANGQTRVRLADRTANVLLARVAPGMRLRLARQPAPWPLAGLALAVHHAEIGAAVARDLGCPERVCWLIAHHEDRPLLDDPDLRLLAEIDDRTP